MNSLATIPATGRAPVPAASLARSAKINPAEQRIEHIRAAIIEANGAVEHAKHKAWYVGFLLLEERDAMGGPRANQHSPDDAKFGLWVQTKFPEISLRTAYTWMNGARNLSAAFNKSHSIEVGGEPVPFSRLLTMPEAELTEQAREYRQEWFTFANEKTMKEAATGAFVEGDESHRITRAHNGKNAKGAGGSGNRKNFTGFIAVKLRHITTFLGNKLTPAEQSKISASFGASVQKWPRWMLEQAAEHIKGELKLKEEERAARS